MHKHSLIAPRRVFVRQTLQGIICLCIALTWFPLPESVWGGPSCPSHSGAVGTGTTEGQGQAALLHQHICVQNKHASVAWWIISDFHPMGFPVLPGALQEFLHTPGILHGSSSSSVCRGEGAKTAHCLQAQCDNKLNYCSWNCSAVKWHSDFSQIFSFVTTFQAFLVWSKVWINS